MMMADKFTPSGQAEYILIIDERIRGLTYTPIRRFLIDPAL